MNRGTQTSSIRTAAHPSTRSVRTCFCASTKSHSQTGSCLPVALCESTRLHPRRPSCHLRLNARGWCQLCVGKSRPSLRPNQLRRGERPWTRMWERDRRKLNEVTGDDLTCGISHRHRQRHSSSALHHSFRLKGRRTFTYVPFPGCDRIENVPFNSRTRSSM